VSRAAPFFQSLRYAAEVTNGTPGHQSPDVIEPRVPKFVSELAVTFYTSASRV